MSWKFILLRFIYKYQRCLVLVLIATTMLTSVMMIGTVYRRKQFRTMVDQDNIGPEPSDGRVNLLDKIKEIAKHHQVPVNTVTEPLTDNRLFSSKPNYNVHVFYYPWYHSQDHDGSYRHWNHKYISHWRPDEAAKWPKGQHHPPDDIGANFYPELGPYSSKDIAIIESHMKQIRTAGIGVLAVSWYPPGDADTEGAPSNEIIPLLLTEAHKYQLKICLHIEPYKGRNSDNMKTNVKYVIEKYGGHPAFYRTLYKGKNLPLFYIYDSYLVSHKEWQKIFNPDSKLTLRNTDIDAVFVGLVAQQEHLKHLKDSGFNAGYTYFAADRFTYGSTRKNWKILAKHLREMGMLFIPSVGPGYIDTRVRPWNGVNTRHRDNGAYYNASFQDAIDTKPAIISITSFNEWHEGSQIETAVPKRSKDFQYLSYEPNRPDYYISLTRAWIDKWISS